MSVVSLTLKKASLSKIRNITSVSAGVASFNPGKNLLNELTNMAESVYSFVQDKVQDKTTKSSNLAMRLLKMTTGINNDENSGEQNSSHIITLSGGALSEKTSATLMVATAESRRDEMIIVQKAQKGDKDSFRILVERYESRLIRCAFNVIKNPEESRDIVQDAFVKAYLALPKFKGDSSFYTWMYRIVLHLAIDLKRKYKRRGGEALEFDEKIGKEIRSSGYQSTLNEQPDDILYHKQQLNYVQKALDEISPEHKEIIMMREVEGFSYEEIASVLGLSLGTVMSRLFYGRKALMISINKFSKEPETVKTNITKN